MIGGHTGPGIGCGARFFFFVKGMTWCAVQGIGVMMSSFEMVGCAGHGLDCQFELEMARCAGNSCDVVIN